MLPLRIEAPGCDHYSHMPSFPIFNHRGPRVHTLRGQHIEAEILSSAKAANRRLFSADPSICPPDTLRGYERAYAIWLYCPSRLLQFWILR